MLPFALLIFAIVSSPMLDVTSVFNFAAGLGAFLFIMVTILIFIFLYDNLRRRKKAPT